MACHLFLKIFLMNKKFEKNFLRSSKITVDRKLCVTFFYQKKFFSKILRCSKIPVDRNLFQKCFSWKNFFSEIFLRCSGIPVNRNLFSVFSSSRKKFKTFLIKKLPPKLVNTPSSPLITFFQGTLGTSPWRAATTMTFLSTPVFFVWCLCQPGPSSIFFQIGASLSLLITTLTSSPILHYLPSTCISMYYQLRFLSGTRKCHSLSLSLSVGFQSVPLSLSLNACSSLPYQW